MAAPCFIAWNGVTSALTAQMTGSTLVAATLQTVLQIAPLKKIRVIEWGYNFTTAPATPVTMELVETGTIFATVSAGSVANYNNVTGPASQATISTSTTGFSASAEGTIVATRLFAQNCDGITGDPAPYFKQQFPLGREPEIGAGAALRVRARGPVVVVLAYVIWEE